MKAAGKFRRPFFFVVFVMQVDQTVGETLHSGAILAKQRRADLTWPPRKQISNVLSLGVSEAFESSRQLRLKVFRTCITPNIPSMQTAQTADHV